ncbi:MAG: lysine biosynthesis protein LysX [Planctomycetota bacterium]
MNSPHDLAVITSRLRVEEKLIFTALERRGVEFERIDDGAIQLDASQPGSPPWPFVWNRSLSYGRTLATTQILESRGVRCFNATRTIELCGDKIATSAALTAAGIATPRTLVAFTEASALEACEELGYPCVIKPVVGSWGRLVARLDGRSAAEAVLEDRAVLGSWQHSVFYLQEYVKKPGRDARAFVIGDECVAAIWRTSEHWITNTARGARTEKAPADGKLGALAVEAARAVGGGMLAVDIVEGPDGPLVLEVNHSMEFRNSIEPTGVDIPGAMAGWVAAQMQEAVAACAEVHP